MPPTLSIYIQLQFHTLLYLQVKKATLELILQCYIHICASNKYAHQMPHMPITLFVDMRQL